jgi:hypothetical protein
LKMFPGRIYCMLSIQTHAMPGITRNFVHSRIIAEIITVSYDMQLIKSLEFSGLSFVMLRVNVRWLTNQLHGDRINIHFCCVRQKCVY